jgi:hypothetical protein
MKMTASLDVALYSIVEVDRRFRWISLMMGAVRMSEMSVYFHETTRCCIPESCHLHPHRSEKLKSPKFFSIVVPCSKPIHILIIYLFSYLFNLFNILLSWKLLFHYIHDFFQVSLFYSYFQICYICLIHIILEAALVWECNEDGATKMLREFWWATFWKT